MNNEQRQEINYSKFRNAFGSKSSSIHTNDKINLNKIGNDERSKRALNWFKTKPFQIDK